MSLDWGPFISSQKLQVEQEMRNSVTQAIQRHGKRLARPDAAPLTMDLREELFFRIAALRKSVRDSSQMIEIRKRSNFESKVEGIVGGLARGVAPGSGDFDTLFSPVRAPTEALMETLPPEKEEEGTTQQPIEEETEEEEEGGFDFGLSPV